MRLELMAAILAAFAMTAGAAGAQGGCPGSPAPTLSGGRTFLISPGQGTIVCAQPGPAVMIFSLGQFATPLQISGGTCQPICTVDCAPPYVSVPVSSGQLTFNIRASVGAVPSVCVQCARFDTVSSCLDISAPLSFRIFRG